MGIKRIWLSTTDGPPWLHNRVVNIVDVVCVEYRLHGKDQFEGAKDLLRESAQELGGDAVIGITFDFPAGGVRATGTVIALPR
jgi:uncharacterized protein YbjQ (UPF0145 family)